MNPFIDMGTVRYKTEKAGS